MVFPTSVTLLLLFEAMYYPECIAVLGSDTKGDRQNLVTVWGKRQLITVTCKIAQVTFGSVTISSIYKL